MADYNSSHVGNDIDTSVSKILTVDGDGGLVSKNFLTTTLEDYQPAGEYLTPTVADNTYVSKNLLSSTLEDYLTSTSAANTYLKLTGGNLTGNLTTSAFINTNGGYGFAKAPANYTFDTSTTTRTLSVQITTHGRPVFLIVSGDLNPLSADTAWFNIYLQRESTNLCHQICQVTGSSWNNPFCSCYLDIIGAGTRTYKATFIRGAGSFTLTEGGAVQGPNFCVFEI